MRTWLLVCILGLITHQSIAQDSICPPSRKWCVVGTETGLLVGGTAAIYQLWYRDYGTGSFRFFNDNPEWLQMDKAGHAYTAYQLSALGHGLMRWSCLPEKHAVWLGAMHGTGLLLVMELLDGYSQGWGFSWGDVAANTLGSAIFAGQQYVWHEQRILPRFSFSPTRLAHYRPELLGDGYASEMLKDYNGQVYWLTFAPQRFFTKSEHWSNMFQLSLGYSGYNMLTGREDDAATVSGIPYLQRFREFHVSLDIDWRYVFRNQKWKVWNTVATFLNAWKTPLPALRMYRGGAQLYLPFVSSK